MTRTTEKITFRNDFAIASVPTSGGGQPLCARNGRELFYLSLEGSLMSVTAVPGGTWKAQPPVEVIDRDVLRDVASAFAPTTSLQTAGVSSVLDHDQVRRRATNYVVQNWMEEWKRPGRR